MWRGAGKRQDWFQESIRECRGRRSVAVPSVMGAGGLHEGGGVWWRQGLLLKQFVVNSLGKPFVFLPSWTTLAVAHCAWWSWPS